jgi:hypothetical protein
MLQDQVRDDTGECGRERQASEIQQSYFAFLGEERCVAQHAPEEAARAMEPYSAAPLGTAPHSIVPRR